MEHFVAGTTARCASSLVRVNAKTAVYYFHRLRETLAYELEQEADRVFRDCTLGIRYGIIC